MRVNQGSARSFTATAHRHSTAGLRPRSARRHAIRAFGKRAGFGGKILVVTAGVEDREAAELIRCGISGIFMKHNSAALLTQGIHDVLAGKVWFEQELLRATM